MLKGTSLVCLIPGRNLNPVKLVENPVLTTPLNSDRVITPLFDNSDNNFNDNNYVDYDSNHDDKS